MPEFSGDRHAMVDHWLTQAVRDAGNRSPSNERRDTIAPHELSPMSRALKVPQARKRSEQSDLRSPSWTKPATGLRHAQDHSGEASEHDRGRAAGTSYRQE